MRYFGGKTFHAKWINGILGPSTLKNGIYCEPFFGMGAVLLGRGRARVEIVSDLNNRVVNWWKVLQASPDELAEAVTSLPSSKSVFDEQLTKLDEGTQLERAVAFQIVVITGTTASDSCDRWEPTSYSRHLFETYADHLKLIARRIRQVKIDNRCATYILDYMKNKENSVIYVDPPYWKYANCDGYAANEEIDITDLLLAQKGRVAISGLDDQWDHLGWKRYEKLSHRNMNRKNNKAPKRTEVLWCNERHRHQVEGSMTAW